MSAQRLFPGPFGKYWIILRVLRKLCELVFHHASFFFFTFFFLSFIFWMHFEGKRGKKQCTNTINQVHSPYKNTFLYQSVYSKGYELEYTRFYLLYVSNANFVNVCDITMVNQNLTWKATTSSDPDKKKVTWEKTRFMMWHENDPKCDPLFMRHPTRSPWQILSFSFLHILFPPKRLSVGAAAATLQWIPELPV